jgi:hypothetical protein
VLHGKVTRLALVDEIPVGSLRLLREVALVEQQVEHRVHTGQPRRELLQRRVHVRPRSTQSVSRATQALVTFASDVKSADRGYDYYRPGYQYGYEAANRYRGRDWNDVESDLRSGWDRFENRSQSTWEHIKDAVRDAWNRVTH